MVMNGSVEQQVQAADMVYQMLETKPNLDTGLSAQAKARAVTVARAVASGMEPERVVEMADASMKPQNAATIDYRKKQVQGKNNPFKFDSVEGQFNKYFASNPEIPDAMRAEYETIAQDYYLNMNMDQEAAKDLALKDVKSKWGETAVGGPKRMMKYAPELFYSIEGVDNEWMHGQLIADVTSIPAYFGSTSQMEDFQDKIRISPRPNSISSSTGIKYDVFVTADDGTIQPYFGKDGKPVIWQPNYLESPAYKEAIKNRKTPQDYINKAREEQKLREGAPSYMKNKIGIIP
jgi:hypothetical protein